MKPAGLQKLQGIGKVFIAGTALLLALVGCATPPPPLKGQPELLSFLADGKTTKERVFSQLGQPSGAFESKKILTYRLGYEPRNQGYFLVGREERRSGWPVWTRASFSLVLVFDDADRLQQHSLVRVNK